MTAADLAAQGFTGCRGALDIEERFTPGRALERLGDGFPITRTHFKRFSACRWAHRAIEGLVAILRENGLGADGVEEISVETFEQAADLDNHAEPDSIESAPYSLPYCLGVAAALGKDALMPLATASLHHPRAVDISGKVSVVRTAEMDALFPDYVPARVRLNTPRGAYEAFVKQPWGEPDRAPDRAE